MSHINCPKCNHEINLANTQMDNSWTDLPIENVANFNHLIESLPEDERQYYRNTIVNISARMMLHHIGGKFVNLIRGPRVDSFEISLDSYLYSEMTQSFTADLSIALGNIPVRIKSSFFSKKTISIEVPRLSRDEISLKEILSSDEFINSDYKLPIIIGKDVFGNSSIKDLTSMPHLLIAGSSDLNKSSFLHNVIISLLRKSTPNKLRLILIDSNQSSFDSFSNVSNLLMPIIHEGKSARNALLWAYEELLRRNLVISQNQINNIDQFNFIQSSSSNKNSTRMQKGFDYLEHENFQLPRIVIVINEWADLVLSAHGSGYESIISAILSNGATCGIHLILSTKRPSSDVLTQKLATNDLTRICFKLNYIKDSYTVLNTSGAENLLGFGDMLLKQGHRVSRFHSAFIEEEKVESEISDQTRDELKFNSSILEFLDRDDLSSVFFPDYFL